MQPAEEIKTCSATLYQSDWTRILLGDSFHPGGLALTQRLGSLLDLQPDRRVYSMWLLDREAAPFFWPTVWV